METKLPHRLTIDSTGMREVIPGRLFMKHLHAETMTVTVYRFVTRAGDPPLPIKPHTHGEEVIVMLRGTERLDIGGVEHVVGENEIFIVPAQTEHQGGQPTVGDHLFLAITSPPRTDLGDAEDGVPTYLNTEAADD